MGDKQKLFENFDKIHTTPLGEIRISKNLALVNMDAVEFCKTKILNTKYEVTQRGKNFYCKNNNFVFVVNSHTFSIITTHKIDKKF